MKTIFLTGHKGFIGSHLLPALSDYEVILGVYNQIPPMPVDYIIHLAGTTTTSASFIPELFDNNIVYGKKIMDCNARIIYASSTSATELTNTYAYTKRYLEYLAIGKNATGLRFFNVYGSGNNKGIIKKAIHCAKTGDKFILQGGYQVRDFIHVSDVVRTIINSLDSTERIIEVGTGEGHTINKVLNMVHNIVGNFEIVKLPYSKTDMEYSVAKPGIEGCIGLEEGIRGMIV